MVGSTAAPERAEAGDAEWVAMAGLCENCVACRSWPRLDLGTCRSDRDESKNRCTKKTFFTEQVAHSEQVEAVRGLREVLL